MGGIFDYISPLGKKNPLYGMNKKIKEGLFGKKEKNYQQSNLTPEQQELHDQYLNAVQNQGAGGAFGDVADYYRDLMSNDSQTLEQLSAPEMRKYNEEIIPDLAHQFAGMGAGNLSSSGFRNASVNAGTDLSERLGALRANLRAQGAQGFQNLAQGALNPVTENIIRPATGGFFQAAAPAVGTAVGTALGGPFGAAAGNFLGNQASNAFNPSQKGTSSPYGGKPQSNFQLPNIGF